MILLPAIDLYDGKVVRLTRGDYREMTVYRDDPAAQAQDFETAGAEWLHVVDLEGAKDGSSPNFPAVAAICRATGLRVEIGGGIRDMAAIDRYLQAGVERVILGTKAVTDPDFLAAALARYGTRIAVGVDIKDGAVAIRGWTETAERPVQDFFRDLCSQGVRTVICTDIPRDGMMGGSNHQLYQALSQSFALDLIASGGVSSYGDIRALEKLGLYGAIVGKALYTGAVDLRTALQGGEGRQ